MKLLVEVKDLERPLPKKEASRAAYALLSRLLSENRLPSSPILRDENGRPYIPAPSPRRFDFNLSHAGRYIAVAIAIAENESEPVRVGIDVEIPHENIRRERLADRFFSENEIERLKKCGYEEKEFLRIWTKKEAYLKFIGTGLSGGMKEADTERADALRVTLSEYETDGNAVVAVCTDAHSVR